MPEGQSKGGAKALPDAGAPALAAGRAAPLELLMTALVRAVFFQR